MNQVNEVRVDDAQLAAEAAAIAAEVAASAPPDPATVAQAAAEATADAETAVQLENAADGYKMIALAFVSQGADLVAPNWQITIVEKTDLADAITQALLLWFPDGILPPKYLALLVILGVSAKIAIARRDPLTGEVPPRHAPYIPPVQPTPHSHPTFNAPL